jgi:NTE family protein
MQPSPRLTLVLSSALAALLVAALLAPVAAAGQRKPRCKPCSTYLPEGPDPCPYEPQAAPAPLSSAAPEAVRALVLEGGGVKGVAYGGSLAVLDAAGHLGSVQQVAGTSAGALTALLVALGYTPAEIHDVLFRIDFRKFRDGSFPGDVERLFEDYGWYEGQFALCLLECLVKKKLGSPDATFADLEAKVRAGEEGFRRLYVFGSDLNTGQSAVFSYEKTPDMSLALAARTSMSIPLFFAAVRLPEGSAGPDPEAIDVMVDGGVLRNYPIDVFDDQCAAGVALRGSERCPVDRSVLGFHLGGVVQRRPIRSLPRYIERLFDTLLNAQLATLCVTPVDVRRSVFIDTLGIGTVDFGLTPQQKCELIQSGADATRRYFEDGPRDRCPTRLEPLFATPSFALEPATP